MNTMALMRGRVGDGTMSDLNPALANLGYFEDGAGNVYYPDGTIMSGPAVLAMSRPLVSHGAIPITVNTAPQLVTLPNGQQIAASQFNQLTPQQQQQLLTGAVTNTGVQLGGTNIPWTWIAIGAVGFMLIQSQPFSRSK
jgi:hypothetical protein